MKPNNFRDLLVWQKAMSLCKEVYVLSSLFPKEEQYGLRSQVQRSAVSIASNIAEGCGRGTTNEFNYFLSLALGSSYECETQMILAFELKYLDEAKWKLIIERTREIQRMISGLKNKISNR